MKKFISNDDLVQKFFADALKEKHVLRDLLVIASLVKLYGHKLNIDRGYLDIIGKKHADIVRLYEVLHTLGKTNSRDLYTIIKICKKIYMQYRKEFTISADVSVQKPLDSFIHGSFPNSDVTFADTSVLGIDLKGEGYRYHRSLDKDLDAILH